MKHIRLSFVFSVFLYVIFLPHAGAKINHGKDIPNAHYSLKRTMIIFVHGTIFPLPSKNGFTSFFSSLFNWSKNPFHAYMEGARTDSIYQYQPIGVYGLNAITADANVSIGTRWAVEATMQAFLCLKRYRLAPLDFYTFGWNGDLSHKKRCKAGQRLYKELEQEITRITTKHHIKRSNLEVIIFAHSHGGNVVLNMATAAQKNVSVMVDKLVLLGTPIQDETTTYIKSPLFGHIFNVYSKGDAIQTLDFISTSGLSLRRFSESLPTLTQITVSLDDQLPSHVELYFFNGKRNILYRRSLCITPFPVFIFVPFLFEQLTTESFAQNLRFSIAHRGTKFVLSTQPFDKDSPPKTIAIVSQDKLRLNEFVERCSTWNP